MGIGSEGLGALVTRSYRGPPVDEDERPFHEMYEDHELAAFLETAAGLVVKAVRIAPLDVPALMRHLPNGGDRMREAPDQYLVRQLFLYLMKPWLGVSKLGDITGISRSTVGRAHADVVRWLDERPALRELTESLAGMIEAVPSIVFAREPGMAEMRVAHSVRRQERMRELADKHGAKTKLRAAIKAGQEEAAAMLACGKTISDVARATGIEFRDVAELFCRLQASDQMVALRDDVRRRASGSMPAR